jgi:5-methylcytosine-specific restriction endonuclease McrA
VADDSIKHSQLKRRRRDVFTRYGYSVCKKCDEEKLLTSEYWIPAKAEKCGFRSVCRECQKIINRARRQANAESHRQYQRDYYSKTPEHIKQKQRDRHREWKKAHPDRCNLSTQKYAARKLGLPDTLTPDQWRFALDYFNGCCAACGRQLKDLFGTHRAAMDHWIPLVNPSCKGTVADNIVPLCHGINGCNNSKGEKEAPQWLVERFGKRKAAKISQRITAYFSLVKS